MISTRRFLRVALPRPEVLSAQNKLRAILKKAQQQGTSLRRAFPHFDKDGDQQISRKELRRGLEELGIEQASDDNMLQCIFDTLDGDSNDIIDFQNFEHCLSTLITSTRRGKSRALSFPCLHTTRPGFREEFQKYEYERSGTCTRAEFRMAHECGLELVDDPQYLAEDCGKKVGASRRMRSLRTVVVVVMRACLSGTGPRSAAESSANLKVASTMTLRKFKKGF